MKKLIHCNNILKPVAHEVKRAGDKYVHLLVMPFCNGSVLDAMNRSRQGLSKSTLLKICEFLVLFIFLMLLDRNFLIIL